MKEQINNLLKTIGLKAEEIVLATETLDNGAATLEAEVFEAGQPVFIVNEDERIPLPVGEYQLDSGLVLVVTEEGVIGEMKEAVAEEEGEMEKEEEVAMDEKAEAPLPKSIIESVTKETKFSADEALLETLTAQVAELKAELAELKAEPKEEIEKEEEVNVELQEEVVEAKKIVHNPEKENPIELFKYGQGKGQDRMSRIISKLNS